jgi:K+-sensing histidine kinase KdpD
MTGALIYRETTHLVLAALMAICLALTVVTFPLALIWFRQPIGTAAMDISDAAATGFTITFIAAFVVAGLRQRSRERTAGAKQTSCRPDRVSPG